MISEIKYGLFKYEVKDYYAVLGVPVYANAQEIRLRYLKIAYQLHPDTCKISDENYKKKASQILSKLVNPAYENLYKDKPRRECELILGEISRKLAADAYKITIATESAKTLFNQDHGREKLYTELLEKLAVEQYQDLDKIITKIALISELNMVYVMFQTESERTSTRKINVPSATSEKSPVIVSASNQESSEPTKNINSAGEDDSSGSTMSRLSRLIRSATQSKEQGNFEQGVLDLREALKIEPNNSTSHALIGSIYLEQGNLTYGKIHIKKAIQLDPNNSLAKESQEKLKNLQAQDKKKPDSKTQKTPEKSSSNKAQKTPEKSKDGKDDKDKKNVPKIFGIPLW